MGRGYRRPNQNAQLIPGNGFSAAAGLGMEVGRTDRAAGMGIPDEKLYLDLFGLNAALQQCIQLDQGANALICPYLKLQTAIRSGEGLGAQGTAGINFAVTNARSYGGEPSRYFYIGPMISTSTDTLRSPAGDEDLPGRLSTKVFGIQAGVGNN